MIGALELRRLLEVAAEVLEESNASGMVIGGCARNFYAPPRGTKDVDLAVEADVATYTSLVASLGSRGFAATSTVSSDFSDPVPDVSIFSNVDLGRIDLLVSKTEFESNAIALAVPMDRLRVARLEDLIAYKLIAGRTRDYADIEDMVRTQSRIGREIDWALVRTSIAPWEIDDRVDRALRDLDSLT